MTTKLTYVEFASANNNPYEKKYYIIKMIVIQIIIMEKVILNFQKVYFKYMSLTYFLRKVEFSSCIP